MTESIIVDQIILVCNGCRQEREYYPDVPITGAEELIEWMKTKTTPCICGAETCDVKCHVKNPEVLKEA